MKKFKRLPVFIINLDSSQSRYETMATQCEQLALTHQRISAIHGSRLSNAEVEQVYCAALNKKHAHRDLTAGEIGCYLSHRKAWRQLIDENIEAAIILEDDVMIDASINELSSLYSSFEHYDIIKLADTRNVPPAASISLGENQQLVNYNTIPNGAMGYIMTQAGAKKFLSRERIFRPVDIDIQHTYELNASVVGIKPYPVSVSTQWDSDISTQNGGQHSNHSTLWRNIKYRAKLAFYRQYFTSAQLSIGDE